MFCFKIDEDLQLRLLKERHAEELLGLLDRDREYFRQWLADTDSLKTLDDVKRAMKVWLEGFANDTRLETGIWFQHQLIGVVGLDEIDQYQKTASMSYYLAAERQGHGTMTTCVRALVSYAFREMDLHRVVIYCPTENAKSRAIPERLGFREEGITRESWWLNDHFVDIAIYAMLAREWNSTGTALACHIRRK